MIKTKTLKYRIYSVPEKWMKNSMINLWINKYIRKEFWKTVNKWNRMIPNLRGKLIMEA